MAENQILVKFKPTGQKALTNAINQLHLAQVKLEKGQKAYERALKKTNLQQKKYNTVTAGGVRNNRIMGGSIATLRSAMLLYSFAVGAVITKIISMTKEQAKLNNLADGFDSLSKSVGLSVGSLENLRIATNNTMSDMDLLIQANNAMILGVGENTSQMAFMFDAAQRLGRVLGRDTKSSVESLITGIGRQSRLMLDNIGIIVKAEQAYEAYAKANNTTADKLSETERKAAFLQATMKGVTEAVAKLGDETDNLQDDIQTLGSFFDNVSASLVSYLGLTDNIRTVTKFYADHAKGIKAVDDEQRDVNDRFKEQQNEIGRTKGLLDAYAETLRNLKFDRLIELGDQIKENNEIITDTGAASLIEKDIDAWADLVNETKELKTELKTTASTTVDSNKKMQILSESIKDLTLKYNNLVKGFIETRIRVIEANAALMLMGGEVIPLVSDAIREMNFEWDNYTKKAPGVWRITEDTKASFGDILLSIANEGKLAERAISMIGDAMARLVIEGKSLSKLKLGEILAQMALSMAITGAMGGLFGMATGGSFLKGFKSILNIAHKGGHIQPDGSIQRFANGGVIAGQDNVPILAQAGEFVMSRNAVDAIGTENLNRMNQGGSGAVNVTFSGNVMSQDFIENEAIPQIKDAIRRGADMGIS